jgi:hypothetical protein
VPVALGKVVPELLGEGVPVGELASLSGIADVSLPEQATPTTVPEPMTKANAKTRTFRLHYQARGPLRSRRNGKRS